MIGIVSVGMVMAYGRFSPGKSITSLELLSISRPSFLLQERSRKVFLQCHEGFKGPVGLEEQEEGRREQNMFAQE